MLWCWWLVLVYFGVGFVGRVRVIVVPLFCVLVALIFPPCASTMRLQIGKPNPMPLALVVKSSVHMRFNVSSDMPTPVSWKLISTSSSLGVLVMVRVPPFGIASNAFFMMFIKTRYICEASTTNCESSVKSVKLTFAGGGVNARALASSCLGVVGAGSSFMSPE